jgi:anti-sigma regulatory factor (Ser/Thr protein kinase)
MRSDRTVSADGHPVSSPHGSGARTKRERRAGQAPALFELMIALDTEAPGAARDFVVACLEQRVVASALDNAQLLVSELVTNSFRHSGATMDEVIVSVELMPDWLRIGVQDSGTDALIAAVPADLGTGHGFGLNLVQMLSQRWGVERLAGGGTRVWAQLARAGGVSAGGANGNGSGRLASRAA